MPAQFAAAQQRAMAMRNARVARFLVILKPESFNGALNEKAERIIPFTFSNVFEKLDIRKSYLTHKNGCSYRECIECKQRVGDGRNRFASVDDDDK